MIRKQIATKAAHRWIGLCTCLIGMSALMASQAEAALTIFDSNGFELPGYSTTYFPGGGYLAQLEGQPGGNPVHWQTPLGQVDTAVIQTAIKESGNQAVRLDRAVGGNNGYGVPVSGYPALGSGGSPIYPLVPGDQVTVSWDMLIPSPAAGTANQFGPFFGVQSYAQPAGAGSLLGTWGVDGTTREVLVQYPLGGGFPGGGGIQDVGGLKVGFDEWHQYKMLLDYTAHTYNVYLDGSLLPTGGIPFLDGAFNTFSDGDITGLAIPNDIAGTGYFDNFLVTENVPEPATWILATFGMALPLGKAARRQMKRS